MKRIRSVLVALLLAVAATGLAVAAIADSPPFASPVDILWATSFLAFPIVGALLALRLPRNAVGWLFLVSPSGVLWEVALDELGRPDSSDSLLALGLVGLVTALLLFPDGHYPNRWFRYAHLVVLVGLVAEPRISPETDGGLSFAAILGLAIAALIHRAWTGDRTLRRQIALPLGVALSGVGGLLLVGVAPGASELIGNLLIVYLLIGIPTGIGIAIFRYRLYDFDRIFSRTVTYTLVIGLLLGVYALASVLLTQVLPVDSSLAVAASTLAAAALFTPLKRRLQRGVDRRFNRVRYQAERELEAFTNRLQQINRDEPVEADLTALLARTLQPSAVGVWIRHRPA
jgi:steroid 5-alpha reductase family enzyme